MHLYSLGTATVRAKDFLVQQDIASDTASCIHPSTQLCQAPCIVMGNTTMSLLPRITFRVFSSASCLAPKRSSNRWELRVLHLSPSRNMSVPLPRSKRLLYENRILVSKSNTPNGEVSPLTTFHYSQSPSTPHIVSAAYSGGSIVKGHLIGTVDLAEGSLEASGPGDNVLRMVYHHVNEKGEIMTGKCVSTPEVLEDGRLRLHEEWEWTSGGVGKGASVVEEVKEDEYRRQQR